MEFQDQQLSPLIRPAAHRIPRKPVPKRSPNEKPGFTFESSILVSPEYAYHALQTPSSAASTDRHPLYPTLFSPPLRKPQPQPLVWRWGLFSGGWQSGCTYCAITAVFVLLVNFCLTLWASLRYGVKDGVGTIFDGKCNKVKWLSLVIHLLINALSTILLGASNYTMQCLSSPTRAEVDKAHERKRWLDIGVPSVRNLGSISGVRLALWCLLSMSSIPLHFIYNSAVFSTISHYDYNSTVTTEDSLPINTMHNPRWEKLNNTECLRTYIRQFIPDRQNVFIVVSGSGRSGEPDSHHLYPGSSLEPCGWICKSMGFVHGTCNKGIILERAESWQVNGSAVQYCLSEKMEEKCSLQYSLQIMIAVIVCNAVKATCMFLVVFSGRNDPLVTVGDAIASFLDTQDETTVGMCVVSKREINNGAWRPKDAGATQRPCMWKPRRHFWFCAVSLSRWMACILPSLVGIGTTVTLLLLGLGSDTTSSNQAILKFPFGALHVQLVTNPLVRVDYSGRGTGLISCILTANLPQAIFSFLYLVYNSIFTCMLLGDEWDRFSRQRRSLRVTNPPGTQRSTYFLQLPYKYSIPLMIGSGFMHWLMSQSIFLARILIIGGQSSSESRYFTAVGWSAMPVVIVIIVASIMLAAVIITGLRRYEGMIPLVGSCSAVISAACHLDPQKHSIATLPIMWGVVSKDGDVGHCSFSGKGVTAPVPGHYYAGTTSKGYISSGGRDMRNRRRYRES